MHAYCCRQAVPSTQGEADCNQLCPSLGKFVCLQSEVLISFNKDMQCSANLEQGVPQLLDGREFRDFLYYLLLLSYIFVFQLFIYLLFLLSYLMLV